MILPTISLSTSSDVFHRYLIHFINNFEADKHCVIHRKPYVIGNQIWRDECYFSKHELIESEDKGKLFGEIEAFPLTDKKLEVRVACLEYSQGDLGVDFFNDFYDGIDKRWGYDPSQYPSNIVLYEPRNYSDNGGIVEVVIGLFLDQFDLYDFRNNLLNDFSSKFDDPQIEARRLGLINQLELRLPPIDISDKGKIIRHDSKTVRAKTQKEKPPRGRPPIEGRDLIYRLAKAQEAEGIRKADQNVGWRAIAREIQWWWGSKPTDLKKLARARRRLAELQRSDPNGILDDVRRYREEEKDINPNK